MVDPDGRYYQIGQVTRYMNHEVGLTQAYLKSGKEGMDEYVAYVDMLDRAVINASEASTKKS
jgi:hypothetical protein